MRWRHVAWGCVLVAGCGPERGWEEPEPVSVACETDEPVRLSTRATSFYNFFAVGDDWTLVDLRVIDEDGGVFDAIVFDPCGGAAIDVFEATALFPAGEGFVRCDGDGAAWALTRDTPPVPLTPSTHCGSATLTSHGLLVQDGDGALQLFSSPDAEPRPISDDIAYERPPVASARPLWFAEGDLVWFVTNDHRVELHDLRSDERVVLSEHVDNLMVSPARDAVGWTRKVADDDPGTAIVHHVATGDVLERAGYLSGLWPGVAVTKTWDEMTVLDLETRAVADVPDRGWYWVLRAEQGVESLIAAVDSGSVPYGKAIGRLDLDTGTFHPFVDVRSQAQIDLDPHGDGIIVTDPIDDDGDSENDRARIVRISSTGATTLVEDAMPLWSSWALAKDGRLLYTRAMADGVVSPDLHVRNPDGTDRVFARDASLVAPRPKSWDAPAVMFDAPDLEGDVLVNLGAGDDAELWRMPFDTP